MTKGEFLFLKHKQKAIVNDITHLNDNNGQYSNLNLNHNNKCAILIPVQSCNKSSKDKRFDSTVSDNYEEKRKSKERNKSSSNLCLNASKLNVKEKAGKQWKKDTSSLNTSNSTLSLHIASFENSTEAVVVASNKIQKSEIKKQLFTTSSSSVIQNSFEFPRQENDKVTEPEVSQFSASQRLLNPNEEIINDQQNPNRVQKEQQLISVQNVQRKVTRCSTAIMRLYSLQQMVNSNRGKLLIFIMNALDQSPKNTVIERLKVALALLITNKEYIPIQNVVQKHDKIFSPPLEDIMKQRNIQSYVELFKLFPNSFAISPDRQSITFARSAPPTHVIPYTQIVGYPSSIKKRAYCSDIFVRKLATNEVIFEPLRAKDFSEIAVPERILLNLKRMMITRLTNIQQHILPYIFETKNDLLIEGTKITGRTIGVLTSILAQLHMFKHITKAKRGPLAVILLQSSPYKCYDTDTGLSRIIADNFCKTLRFISESLDIKIGFDSIDTSKDIAVITFNNIHEYEERCVEYVKFFVVFNVEHIINQVGHEVFVARITAFVPKHAVTIFVMTDYHDPHDVKISDCLKPDAIFISDKS